jgi:hypothetical protein
MQWNSSSATFDPIEIIRPVLHHALTFGQVFGAIIRASHLVALAVSKLALNHVRPEPGFVKDR